MIQARVVDRWYQEAHQTAVTYIDGVGPMGWARRPSNSLRKLIQSLSEQVIRLVDENKELRAELQSLRWAIKELSRR